jgi:hypothetical protein
VWIWNTLAQKALEAEMDYIFQLNDDVSFVSNGNDSFFFVC